MAEQASIMSNSEAQLYVVLDHVFEFINDIRTITSLTLVSKRVRKAVYLSNGLRELIVEEFNRTSKLNKVAKLNEVGISRENLQEKIKDGIRWLWTVGKRLKTIRVYLFVERYLLYKIVLPSLNTLVTTEKRRIENIDLSLIENSEMPYEWAFDLVQENRNTLRFLDVRMFQVSSFLPSSEFPPRNCSLSQPSETENFWSVVRQCERLESLDLCLHIDTSPIFPPELVIFLCERPLKHLGLGFISGGLSDFVKTSIFGVLSIENLRKNLESLTLNSCLFYVLFGEWADELTIPRLSTAFVNITKLTFAFFTEPIFQRFLINWLAFWIVFPALNEIKGFLLLDFYNQEESAMFSKNMSSFCKTYLEVSGCRSCDVYMKVTTDTQELIRAVATAVSFPEDQEWCVSHGVQIETENRDEKVERVTLRKNAATLIFHFKYKGLYER